ncbi:MFS transporter [Patescibacteria group bacterium]|nr:MFS transporter [Patescibacteria group bacterium]MBU1448672.1 MFS transporter [Patescibacteria group bacterium]
MQAWFARWRERYAHAWYFVVSNKRLISFASVAIVVGVFVVAVPAHADDDARKWVLGIFGEILGWIILMLGKLIILVANILVAFAQYNSFVKSSAVTTGWPLVRDVVNMFFIVVLLVTAFSTIVRYQELHYSKILPKLLLMAVLINFSKTLIGLLIDFSQVITLTFVSAFQQAAGGNFITAFKLTKMTALGKTEPGDPKNTQFVELIVASMLAIILMTVALLTLLLMALFFAFRIVVLWILLILSPIAFFALALPAKLSKAVQPFTNKWWDQLSTMLVAGPVMAFFLWLGLAIAQGPDPFKDTLGGASSGKEAAGLDAFFSTQVGTVDELGTFLVAVVFMLTGLQFAMKTSGSVPGMARTANALRSVPGRTYRGGTRLASGALNVARKTGKLGFEGVDRLADVRGRAGKLGLAVSNRLGGVGAATFAGMAGHRGERIKAKQTRLKKVTENLDEKTAQKFLRGRASSKVFTREAAAAQMALADRATNSLSQKTLTTKFDEELQKKNPTMGEVERLAMAESMAKEQRGKDLKAGMKVAGDFGFDDKMEGYGEKMKKDASLGVEWEDYKAVKNATVTDWKGHVNGISADSMKDGRAFLAQANALGLVAEDGSFKTGGEADQIWAKLEKGNMGGYIKEHRSRFDGNQEAVKAQLAAMEGGTTEEHLKLANETRTYATEKKGTFGSVLVNVGAQPERAKGEAPEDRKAREDRMSRARDRVQMFVDRGPEAAASSEAQGARFDLLASGGKISQAYKYDEKKGEFADDDQRALFDESLQSIRDGVGKGDEQTLRVITQFDTAALKSQPTSYNEARSAMVMQMSPEVLMQGYQQANRGGNEAAKGKIREVVDVIAAEAERVKKIAADAHVSVDDFQKVVKAPMSSDAEQVKRKLISGGFAKNERAAEAMAHAVASGHAIETDEGMREIRNTRSQRAQSRVDAARTRTGRGKAKA